MIIDNYIEAAKTFLCILNLRFDTDKTDVLINQLLLNGNLAIYDSSNKKIGTLVSTTNNEYKIYIDINGSKIEVKSYRNTLEPSKFEFKYKILRTDKFYKLSGFYSFEVKNKKTYVSNEFKLYEDGTYKLYVYFRPTEKRYGLVEKNYGREVRVDKDEFKFFNKEYKFKLENGKKGVYYQLEENSKTILHDDKAPKNFYGGAKHKLKKDDMPEYILRVLGNELDDYFGFINDTRDHLQVYSDGIFVNSVDTCLTGTEEPKKRLFINNRQ